MYIKNNKMGHTIDLTIRTSIILTCIAYLIVGYPTYEPLPKITSAADTIFLNTIGIHTVNTGRFLVVSFPSVDRIYELSFECCGLILFSMFVIAIFVVPSFSYKHRFIAMLFLPLMFFGNIFRIALGIIIGYQFSADASMFFHDTFGQILIFIWVIVCFLLWLKITKNFPSEKKEVKKI
jgi:exosortase/archaeosortase family protein